MDIEATNPTIESDSRAEIRKAIGLVDSFLSGTGLDHEQIKDKKTEEYIEYLSPSTLEEKPEELVYKKS